jgi:zinc transporter 2
LPAERRDVSEFSPNTREKLIDEHNKPKEKNDDIGENMNMRAAVVHIMGDMVQSIGVIAASIIIKFKPEWQIADPICTYVFSVLVMLTTVPIFIDCVKIVMEATPSEIDTKSLYNDILRLKTVEELHDFHCWTLAGGKYILTCHVRSDFGDKVVRDINRICKNDKYGIFHTTIQVERHRKNAHVISCDHLV